MTNYFDDRAPRDTLLPGLDGDSRVQIASPQEIADGSYKAHFNPRIVDYLSKGKK